MKLVLKRFLRLLPKSVIIWLFKISKFNYEIILSNPIFKKFPNYPSNVDYKLEMLQELRKHVSYYINQEIDNDDKFNFLNIGCGTGLLEGQIFVDDSLTDMYPIKREKFFSKFDYYTLEYFDLDLNSIKNRKIENRIYQSAIKDFSSLNIKDLDKYPKGFQKDHLKADISDPFLRTKYSNKKNFFDIIYLLDVLEHVENPFESAKNIDFLLKDKGKIIIIVPFSYPYHEDPEDYWRFTHRGLEKLFSESNTGNNYESVHLGYDITQRRDNRKGNSVPLDSFGGWRENWHTFCVLKKIQN